MKIRIALNFGLSALLFGGVVVGCTQGGHVASASSRDASRAQSQAADLAAKGSKALASKKGGKAVQFAEAAVALQPQDAAYRALLGQSYLQAGRFGSAHQAFADVLTLDPSNARAALNLALAQTAEGDWAGARDTLNRHSDTIPASDRGLALALAGDPKGAVAVLMPAARGPGADAKLRQNLALSLALAGDWHDARVIVGMDLSPAQVDVRLGQWASFAQPHAASDQVASLLGVKPSQDPGLPVALALNAPSAPIALAEVKPVVAEPRPSDTPPAETANIAETPSEPERQMASVTFAPRHEVVQRLPSHAAPQIAVAARQGRGPAVENVAARPQPRQHTSGSYFVQLGAYENAAVAHDGWLRATRVFPGFAGETPQGMSFSANGASVYRLSVGGYAKADARRLCNRYQARGGRCFIRTGAGDQVASWVKKGAELASR